MRTITKEIKRDMAHRLPNYQWKCRNVHWHTYKMLITLSGKEVQKEWSQKWMLRDFSLLKPIKERIDENRDHSYVWVWDDEVFLFLQDRGYKTYQMECDPTAENMAKFIYDKFRKEFPIESITIYETPTSFSTYNWEDE